MITVISQTTQERNEETRRLFESIRPLLDDGYSYTSALKKLGKINNNAKGYYYGQAWFRELREYGETQGYKYREYSGKGRKR